MKLLEDMAEEIGISKLVLMENAGLQLANGIQKQYSKNKSKNILIVCGSGNNGGDGLVCARYLVQFANEITICLLNINGKLKTNEVANANSTPVPHSLSGSMFMHMATDAKKPLPGAVGSIQRAVTSHKKR